MIQFTILGDPKGKGRHKARYTGTFVQMYTPKDTVSYENLVKMSFVHEKQMMLPEGPIKVEIKAYLMIPKSMSKKNRQLIKANRLFPTKKPDFDNIGKIVCDALNGLAYGDDKQVVDGRVIKLFGEQPRVEVKMWTMEEVREIEEQEYRTKIVDELFPKEG